MLVDHQKCDVVYFNCHESVNTAYISDFKARIFNDSEGFPRINMSGNLLVDMQKVSIIFWLKGKTDQRVREYDRVYVSANIDTCKASQGVIANFIASNVLRYLKDYTNILLQCPFKRGFYYVKNFPMMTDRDLPKYNLPKIGHFVFKSIINGRPVNGKKGVHLWSSEIFGGHT